MNGLVRHIGPPCYQLTEIIVPFKHQQGRGGHQTRHAARAILGTTRGHAATEEASGQAEETRREEVEEGGVEMRTSVKAPLIILSALALIAGCIWVWDTTRLKNGPKTGYLHFGDDSAMFVKWTQEGQKLKGTIDAVYRKLDGSAGRVVLLFQGALNGEMVNLDLSPSGTAQERFQTIDKTITGTLRGDTLALLFGDGANGAQPVVFRRASEVEFLDAYLKLQRVAAIKTTAK